MKPEVALVGAGGKMGMRIGANLRGSEAYSVLHCEIGAMGLAELERLGAAVIPGAQAVPQADFTVLAVPDARIGSVSRELVPLAKEGSTIIVLDPAAAMADELALRDDCGFIVAHPCHPPLFAREETAEARRDFFGGVAARQDIVMALLRGGDEVFRAAETLCRAMFAPVVTAHRITLEQMAILEPAMAEVVAASAAVLMGEALEEAVRRGVPRRAATSFMLGHAQIPLAIVFGAIDSPFSDAAQVAVRYGLQRIYREDWKDVFSDEQIRECIQRMLHPEGAA